MTLTLPERSPEEGPDFVSTDAGTLTFEPYAKPRPRTELGRAALEATMRAENITLAPWWDEVAQSDAGAEDDPLLAWEASITDQREPWERRGGTFRMRFEDTEVEED